MRIYPNDICIYIYIYTYIIQWGYRTIYHADISADADFNAKIWEE